MCMPNPQVVPEGIKPAIFLPEAAKQRGVFIFSILAVLACLVPSFVSAATNTDTLQSYWKFDETAAGSDATDASDDGHTGVATGATGPNNEPAPSTITAGGFAFPNTRSRHFDAVDDHFTVTDTFDPTTYTISMWIRPSSTTSQNLFVRTDGSGPLVTFSHQLKINAGVLQHYLYDGNVRTVSSTYSLTANTWYHVTAVATNSGLMNLYVNGLAQSTGVAVGTMWTGGDRYYIGSNASGMAWYYGYMDDVRLYSRALSQTEITSLAGKTHTSATWDGMINDDWENASNWSPAFVPDNYANVTVRDNGGDYANLSANVEVGSLSIVDSWAMYLGGFNLTFNDSGAFSNEGYLYVQGTETISSFSNDINSGTIGFMGTDNSSNDAYAMTNVSYSYFNVEFFNSEAGSNIDTFYMDDSIEVYGNITIQGSIFDIGDYWVYLYGNYSNASTGRLTSTEYGGIDFTAASPATQTLTGAGYGTGREFPHLYHSGSSSFQISPATSVVVRGNLYSVGDFDANGATITVWGAASVQGGNYQAKSGSHTYNGTFAHYAGTFTGSSGIIDMNSSFTILGGTFIAPATMRVSGNWAKTGGIFTAGSSTVTFDLASATQTVRTGGSAFGSIAHTANGTVRLLDDLTVNGTFSQIVGIFEANGRAVTANGLATFSYIGSTNELRMSTNTLTYNNGLNIGSGSIVFTRTSGNIDINGDLSVGGGSTFNIPITTTMTVSGNFSRGSGATFTNNFNLNLDGTGTQTFANTNFASGDIFHLTHSAASTVQVVSGSSFTISHLTNSAGTFDLNKTTVTVSRASHNYANLRLFGTEPFGAPSLYSGSSVTIAGAGTMPDIKIWSYYTLVFESGVYDFSLDDFSSIAGDFVVNGGTVTMSWGVNNAFDVGGNIVVRTGTLNMTPDETYYTANSLLMSGGTLTLDAATFGVAPSLMLAGDFTLTGGAFYLGFDGDAYMYIAGNVRKTANASYNYVGAGGFVMNKTSGVQTIDFNGPMNSPLYKEENGTVQVVNNDLTGVYNFEMYAGTFSANGRAVSMSNVYLGGGTYMAGTGVQTLPSITMDSGQFTVSPGGTIDAGAVTLNGSVLTLTNALMTVSGNWVRSGFVGTFNNTGSTVTFDGTGTQTFSGSTTFYALRALTSGATLQFTNGTTQYATNSLHLQNISLKSGTNGTTSYFRFSGTNQNISNVRVRDINSSNGNAIYANNSTNLGNTTNWNFGQTLYWIRNVSGTPANISNTSFWSTTSGGGACFCTPGAADNVVFDGNGISGAIINGNVTVAKITATSAYTGAGANDGHIDNSGNYAISVTSNVVLDNKQVSMGTATWTISGSFDNESVTTFDSSGSTLTLNGSGDLIGASYANGLKTVIINGDYNVPSGETVYFLGRTTINGTLSCGVAGVGGDCILNGAAADMYITSAGLVDGQLILFNQDSSLQQLDGRITVTSLQIYNRHQSANSFAPGTYEAGTIYITNQASQDIEFLSGTYVFTGEVLIAPAGFTLGIRNNVNNPSFIFNKSIDTKYGSGSTSWTRGTGTVAFSSNTFAQYVNFYGAAVENIVSSNTSSTGLTFSSSFTTPSLYVNAAGLGSAATVYFSGHSTFTVSTFTIIGAASTPVVLKSTASAAWRLNNTHQYSVTGAQVSYSSATGNSISATDSVNLGNNSRWAFSNDLYWVGTSPGMPDSWTDGTKWSTTSGGAPCGCTPSVGHTVRFDGNGTGNMYTPSIDVVLSSWVVTSGYTGAIYSDSSHSTITVNSLSVSGGTLFDLGKKWIKISGNWDTSGASQVSLAGSTVVFNGSGSQSISAGTTFYAVYIINTSPSPSDSSDVDPSGYVNISKLYIQDGQFQPANGSRIGTLALNTGGILKPDSGATILATDTLWDMNGSGVFTPNSGTLMFIATGAVTIEGSWDFHNLILNDGLIGYWKFDETSGSVASDSSGYVATGTLVSMDNSDWVAGSTATQFYTPRALDFDGSSDYINAGNLSELDGVSAFTIAAWIKPDLIPFSGYDGLFGRGGTNQRSPWIYGQSVTNKMVVDIETTTGGPQDAQVISNTSIVQGIWQHVAFTWDGTNVRIYINGVQDANTGTTDGNVLATPDESTRLGAINFNASSYWDGQIDDFRVYKRALSPAEISLLGTGYQPQTVVSTFTIDNSILDVTGNLVLNGGRFAPDEQVNVHGSWLNHGSKHGNHIIASMHGTSAYNLQSGGQHFSGLDVSGSGTLTLNDALFVDNELIVTAGTFLNSVSSKTVTVGSGATFSNTRTDMGYSTWTVAGGFNNKNVTTFNHNGSTLTLTSGNWTGASYDKTYGNVIITGNVTVPGTESIYTESNLIVSGTLTCGASGSGMCVVNHTGDLKVLTGGVIQGNHYVAENHSSISQMDGRMLANTFVISGYHGVFFDGQIATGTYESPIVHFYSVPGVFDLALELKAGTYVFPGDVYFNYQDTDNVFTFNNALNNPNLVFGGDVFREGTWGLTKWIPGTGTITFSSNTAQAVSLFGSNVENIVSSNTSSGGLTFTSSFTAQSFTVNATALGSAATVYFAGHSTFTVSTFTITGNSSTPVILKSTSTAQWRLNNTHQHSVVGVQVASSNATGNTITATQSVNLGNNTNWSISGGGGAESNGPLTSAGTGNWHNPATWGGVLPSTSATVTITSPHVVTATSSIRIASVTVGGTLTLQGNSTFYWLTTNSGSTLNQGANALYFSSKTVLASGTFVRNAAGRSHLVGDFELNQNSNNLGHAIVGQSPDTITLTSDAVYDSLTINPGDVFRTNGYEVTVTTDIVILPGGYLDTSDSYASNEGNGSIITITEDLYFHGGAGMNNVAGSTVVFNGAVAQVIVGTATFHNLEINNTHATPADTDDVDPSSAVVVANNLLITDGQFQPATDTQISTVAIGANGIFKPDAASTVFVSGGWSNAGTYTIASSTINLNNSSGILLFDSGGIAAGKTFQVLKKTGAGTVRVINSTVSVSTALQLDAGTFDISTNARRLTVTSNLIVSGGTLNAAGGTIDVDNNVYVVAGNLIAPSSQSGTAFVVEDDFLITDTGTFTHSNGRVTMDNDTSGAIIVTTSSNPDDFYQLEINDNNGTQFVIEDDLVVLDDFIITAGLFDTKTGENNALTVGGDFTVATCVDCHFTAFNGTVTFNGSAAQTISAGTTFYNLVINNTHGTPSDANDVDPAGIIYVQNVLTVNDGQFQPHTGTLLSTVTINAAGILKPDASAVLYSSGNWSNAGTFTPNSGTLTFNKTSSTQTFNPGGSTYQNIAHTGGATLQLVTSHLTANGNIVNSSGVINTNGRAVTVYGMTTLSTGAYLTSTNIHYLAGGLTISGGTFVGSTATVTTGAVYLTAGALYAPNYLEVGYWDRSGGTFVAGASTVAFNSQPDEIYSRGTVFNNVIFLDGSGYYLRDNFDVNGNLLIGQDSETSAELYAGTHSITVGGNWYSGDSSFIPEASTVTFDGTGVQTLSYNGNFYGLRAITPGATLQFDAGQTFSATNMVDLRNITLKSTSNNATWYFVVTGSSKTIGNVRVRDSNASGGNALNAGASSDNLGNNTNWIFGGGNVYWRGTAHDGWEDGANWSLSSAGPACGCLPGSADHVWIDSGANENVYTNSTIAISSLTVASDFPNEFGIQAPMTVTNNVNMAAAVYLTSVLNVGGNYSSSTMFSFAGSTVSFNGSGAQTITAPATFYNLLINNTAASPSDSVDVDPTGYIYVQNVLTVNDGQFQPHNNSQISTITINAGGILKPDSGATIISSGNWTNNGTFTHNNGTIFLTGVGSQYVNAGGTGTGKSFYNIDIMNTHPSPNDSNDVDASSMTVENILNLSQGQFQPATGSTFGVLYGGAVPIKPDAGATLYITADFDVVNFVHNNGTIDFIGSGPMGINTSASFNRLIFSGSGSLTPIFNGLTSNELIFRSGAGMFDNSPEGLSINVSGNVTMDNDTVDMGGAEWHVTGNFISSGVVTMASSGSTLYMEGSGSQLLSAPNLGAITVNNSAATPNDSNDVETVSAFAVAEVTINDGQFQPMSGMNLGVVTTEAGGILKPASGATIGVSGNWYNNGTFLHNNGTVQLLGASQQDINSTVGNAFNNLRSSNTSAVGVVFLSSFTAAGFTVDATALGGAATVYFLSNATATISTFTITGSGNNLVTLKPTSSAAWRLNNTHQNSVSGARVSSSNASLGLAIYPTNSTNLGNNTNWIFFADGSVASVQTGNWHTPATWGGVIPSTSATVTVTSPHVVTATGTITVASMTVAGTLTLQANSTFYWFTTNSGSTLNQGANQIYFSSKTVLATGTFQKNAAGRVYLNGNFELRQNGQNIGNTIVGLEP